MFPIFYPPLLHLGDAVDEASHEQQHNGVVERLKFPGWRNERNCGEEESGRMLMVQPGDPRHMWKKVEDALSVVDRYGLLKRQTYNVVSVTLVKKIILNLYC